MIDEKIFLRTRSGDEAFGPDRKRKRITRVIIKSLLILVLFIGAWKAYDVYWLRHRYLITAYCNCPICINIASFRDGKFASRRPVYWGGVAADKSIPFGSSLELVPVTPRDWLAVWRLLGTRRNFTVEDRGGKIDDRHIDIYFPHSHGGHQAAVQWGVRRMRVKINGRFVD